MKSILSKLIIALLLLSSCGYKIVNDISDFKFQVIETEFNGNPKINKELQRYFSRLDSKDATRFFEINVASNLTKKVTSKNSLGEDASYSIKIIVKLEILENNKIIKTTKFEKNTNYNNLASQFELKQYENLLINDLTEQITYEISRYLDGIQ